MKFRTIVAVLALLLFCPAFENPTATQAAGGKKDVAAEVEALKVQVAQLAKQAQNSQDYIAIANLQRAYGYYVDKCQWDQTADLFAKDGTLEIGLRGGWGGQDRGRPGLHTP